MYQLHFHDDQAEKTMKIVERRGSGAFVKISKGIEISDAIMQDSFQVEGVFWKCWIDRISAFLPRRPFPQPLGVWYRGVNIDDCGAI
jgi:hypothetical protein